MNTSKIIITSLAITLLFAGCGGPTFAEPTRPQIKNSFTAEGKYSTPLQINDQTIYVEVVNTDETRTLGLSGRESLSEGTGMLFDFTNTNVTKPSFWMKDMKFAIDIVWINNSKIIGITPNVPAPTDNQNLPTYPPPSNITHVLELPSGYAEKANIKVGDTVKF